MSGNIHAMASGLTRPFWRRVRRWILTGDRALVLVAYGLLAAIVLLEMLRRAGVAL